MILGFDPGRQKCGLALMGVDRVVRYHQVVSVSAVIAEIHRLRQEFPIVVIVLGDQTGADRWQAELGTLSDAPRLALVDERYSSLEARDRYWQMYPPRGLAGWIPQALRPIPRPIDDIVAILLIERYLSRLTQP
ncbi:MAG: resolvase [Cyanobacteria bacterium REEB459]|nr:resolvase [Cyanobacteria bacterium REEB459]